MNQETVITHVQWAQLQKRLSMFFYISIGFIVVGAIAFATFKPILVLPRIRLAPGFAMQDLGQNSSLRNDDLRGGLTLYTFVFSDCLTDSACLQNLEVLEQLYTTYSTIQPEDPKATLPLNMVTVLLDKNDDLDLALPSSIAAQWHIVNGDELQTRYVVGQGFKLFYAEQGEDGREKNYVSPMIALVDGMGMIRSEYRQSIPETEILVRDVNLLQEEFLRRQGIGRFGYEAAHLFVCYP